MSIRPGVLMMTSDSATAHRVAHALTTNGHALTTTTAARDFPELLEQLKSDPVAIAVVDLDPRPQATLTSIERAIEQFPTSRFVAITESVTSDLLLDAMQAGVRRVLPKSVLIDELPSVLNRLCPPAQQHSSEDGGRVITVLSAGGGAGATMLAVNLACEIATDLHSAQPQTLLIDLDCAYGAASILCGLAPKHCVGDVLHTDHAIDAELLSKSVIPCSGGLHVLASPASLRPPRSMPLDYSRLGELVVTASRCYRTVVIDAPRLPHDVFATLACDSDAILLVLQLNVKDLRMATATLDALQEQSIPRDRVIAVANRVTKPTAISVEDAARVIGVREILRVRDDAVSASECVNSGRPLVRSAEASTLRSDIRAILPHIEAHVAAAPS